MRASLKWQNPILLFLFVVYAPNTFAQNNSFFNQLLPAKICPNSNLQISPVIRTTNEDNVALSATVTLNIPACRMMNIYYGVTGNAVSGTHYNTLQSGFVSIAKGATTANINFNLQQNALTEVEKSLRIYIIGASSPFDNVTLGTNINLQQSIIDDETTYRTVSKMAAGGSTACAKDSANYLKCWGRNNSSQVGDGTITDRGHAQKISLQENFTKISIGFSGGCGITNAGVLKCWGYGPFGNGQLGYEKSLSPSVIDPGVTYSQVSTTENSRCGITTAGVLKCWGYNSEGQLGDGTTTTRYTPVVVQSGTTFTQVSAGYTHACAITTAQKVRCWGDNDEGQLGKGDKNSSSTPVEIDASTDYTMVSAGEYFSCGIVVGGALKCWGDGAEYRLGNNSQTDRTTPVVVNSGVNYSLVSAGRTHACGITTTGVLKCWGVDSFGEVGNGGAIAGYAVVTTPAIVDTGVSYSFVHAARESTCGITTTGELKCWGLNSYYQIGDGTKTNRSSPVVVDSGVNYSTVTGNGMYNRCGITTAGVRKCWGSNDGEFGDGTGGYTITPAVLDSGVTYTSSDFDSNRACALTSAGEAKCWNYGYPNLMFGDYHGFSEPTLADTGFASLTSGESSTCGITAGGVLKCWGINGDGAVGNGTMVDVSPPAVVIDTGQNYLQVDAGKNHTCGITSTNVLKCWGSNSDGQLGDGSGGQTSPTIIDPGVSYSYVSAGWYHTCAITTAGVVKCWGYNNDGQLGNASNLDSTLPVIVDAGVTYSKVAAGLNHTCAIRTTGAVKCWGANYYGMLGDGTYNSSNVPVAIDSGVSYSYISTGWERSCGITTTGSVLKCWGQNDAGQLGLGNFDDTNVPTVVDSGTSYQSVSAAVYKTCGVTTGGVLKCAGYSEHSIGVIAARTPTVIDGDATVSSVAVGKSNACAIGATTGKMKCWGLNSTRQIDFENDAKRSAPENFDAFHSYTSVGVGGGHICAVDSNFKLRCQGLNDYQQAAYTGGDPAAIQTVDPSVNYAKVATGTSHSCAIVHTTGVLKCWGRNTNGRLGDGTTTQRSSPTIIQGGAPYSEISLGDAHTCGIMTTGELRCWGLNSSGQLGDLSSVDKNTPTTVNSGTNYISVATGAAHSCGVTSGNVLKCWGLNNHGQLGFGNKGNILAPTVVDSGVNYSSVVAGDNFTCARTTGGIMNCWGENSFGNIGYGYISAPKSPEVVDAGTLYSDVEAGDNHVCAKRANGQILCWGYNLNSRLGDNSLVERTHPIFIDNGRSYNSLGLGASNSCGINASSKLNCWGSLNSVNLGMVPTVMNPQTSYIATASGLNHMCAITNGNKLFCRGINTNGQLGHGNTTPQAALTATDSTVDYSRVSAGDTHTCATVATTNALRCWGQQANGRLGTNATAGNVTSPTNISGGDAYLRISAGDNHTCGIRASGNELRCWGLNTSGQLGDTTTTQRLIPTLIDSGVGYSEVSSGETQSCGITTAGVLKCWGTNEYGLGDAAGTTVSTAPLIVDSGVTYSKISVGADKFACGVTTAGVLKCWGNNINGQMGSGLDTTRPLYVPAVRQP